MRMIPKENIVRHDYIKVGVTSLFDDALGGRGATIFMNCVPNDEVLHLFLPGHNSDITSPTLE
jgi:hypothetical protein